MERVIYKYALRIGPTEIELPKGSEFVDLQVQGLVPTVWFSVPADENIGRARRRFEVIATGQPHEMLLGDVCLGSFQVEGFVGHVVMRAPHQAPDSPRRAA